MLKHQSSVASLLLEGAIRRNEICLRHPGVFDAINRFVIRLSELADADSLDESTRILKTLSDIETQLEEDQRKLVLRNVDLERTTNFCLAIRLLFLHDTSVTRELHLRCVQHPEQNVVHYGLICFLKYVQTREDWRKFEDVFVNDLLDIYVKKDEIHHNFWEIVSGSKYRYTKPFPRNLTESFFDLKFLKKVLR